jgi:four helix bundle protein
MFITRRRRDKFGVWSLGFGVAGPVSDPEKQKMQDFKNLNVWQKAHVLAIAVYRATSAFPREELYGLTSQTRRACVSIPANIAEGCGRQGNAELNRYLQISLGSARELEYHLLLARDLSFLDDNAYEPLEKQVSEVRRMLISFIKKLREIKEIKVEPGVGG